MQGADAQEIDAYIERYKTPRGYVTGWSLVTRRNWQTRWPIVSGDGVENSELCLAVSRDWRHQTILCIHRQRLIYRLDIAPKTECKPNHHAAWKQGLPNQVCGPHVHGWPENREYVMENGHAALPFRRPIDGLCETLSDALGWVAEDMNIHIAPDQRDFDMPDRSLF
jgi:hypothetical protein